MLTSEIATKTNEQLDSINYFKIFKIIIYKVDVQTQKLEENQTNFFFRQTDNSTNWFGLLIKLDHN